MTSPITILDAQRVLDRKTKPPGSLGYLETVAARLAALQNTYSPRADRVRCVVFAADHGVADEGVSAYPKAVTAEMVRNFVRGGAAVTALGRVVDAEVEVVDVGTDADIDESEGEGARLIHAKVRGGSRNLLRGPAMTIEEMHTALEAGRDAVRRAAADGIQALALGEMGIGNTTSASTLLAALTGYPVEEAVGRGTGVGDERMAHKREVVAQALARHKASGDRSTHGTLASLGGLEIAALAGAMLEAAGRRLAVVVDGFIVTVAALVAVRLGRENGKPVAPALFFAHEGAERGHRLALEACAEAGCYARPLLQLDLRLGEASGAMLALPLLRCACALFDMASFAEAEVSGALSEEADA
ncbi:MAG: nicotinate-nucleotide--dimethylbenzimidazole phosphoribosyltransferase [Bacteroidota bacterium]